MLYKGYTTVLLLYTLFILCGGGEETLAGQAHAATKLKQKGFRKKGLSMG
jgi:hypothetical protein